MEGIKGNGTDRFILGTGSTSFHVPISNGLSVSTKFTQFWVRESFIRGYTSQTVKGSTFMRVLPTKVRWLYYRELLLNHRYLEFSLPV